MTNGPWVEFSVAETGLGGTVRLEDTSTVRLTARTHGLGVERLEIVGPHGVVASAIAHDDEEIHLDVEVDIDDPTWLAAIARGGEHPAVLGPRTYAHTSPIWIEIAGRSVAKAADAEWCLEWLERFEHLARGHAHFDEPHHLHDFVDVLDSARVFYKEIINESRSGT